MNQRLNDESDLTEDEKRLFQKLEAARSEYESLSYPGELPLLESKQKRRWIPLGIAASVITIAVLSLSVQLNKPGFAKPKFTLSKIDIKTSFPSGLSRSPKINNKKISLFAQKPVTRKKSKSSFSVPVRPAKRAS